MAAKQDQIIARVSINSPLPHLDRLFDYLVPLRLRDQVSDGIRVKVPFRNGMQDGFIVQLSNEIDYDGKLAELEEIVSEIPVLQPEIYQLARKIADRSVGTVRDILRLAIPTRQVRAEKRWLAEQCPTDFLVTEPKFSSRLQHYPAKLIELLGAGSAKLALDLQTGVEKSESKITQAERGTDGKSDSPEPVTLLRSNLDLAHIAKYHLRRGQSVIFAVPDYRDIDRLSAAFAASGVAADSVLRIDSRQSNSERYTAFLNSLRPVPKIILGNRSALFSAAHNLGLIIVVDDQDPLHYEPLAPYQNSKDVALIRQQLQNCSLIFASLARSVAVQRLVEVGWLAAISPIQATPRIILPPADADGIPRRIPSLVWQGLSNAVQKGPILVQVARPTASAELYQTDKLPTAKQTAAELGRAFPGVQVIVADGTHPVLEVPDKPSIVIATRGAEPIAAAGYQAVLLLDGLRLLGNETVSVAENCRRWWSNAIALASSDAICYLPQVTGRLAQQLATWQLWQAAAEELQDRRELRFPPAVRVVQLLGDSDPVNQTIAKLEGSILEWQYLPTTSDQDETRILAKFEYRNGEKVQEILRAEVTRYSIRQKRQRQRLRVRIDEVNF